MKKPNLGIGQQFENWDNWLESVELALKGLGYKKYIQHYKSEDFMYWKTFYDGEDKAYLCGLGFYDFRKYKDIHPTADFISVQFECMISGDDRIDMTISKDIIVVEFEKMCKQFYESIKQFR